MLQVSKNYNLQEAWVFFVQDLWRLSKENLVEVKQNVWDVNYHGHPILVYQFQRADSLSLHIIINGKQFAYIVIGWDVSGFNPQYTVLGGNSVFLRMDKLTYIYNTEADDESAWDFLSYLLLTYK
jgi:hypothetical protein